MGVNITSWLHKVRDFGRIRHILSNEQPFFDPLQIVFINIMYASNYLNLANIKVCFSYVMHSCVKITTLPLVL